jgi:hypothetical protein
MKMGVGMTPWGVVISPARAAEDGSRAETLNSRADATKTPVRNACKEKALTN